MFFLLGLFSGTMFLEPIIINFIYFRNVDLFCDIILTEKNYKKLERKFKNEIL